MKKATSPKNAPKFQSQTRSVYDGIPPPEKSSTPIARVYYADGPLEETAEMSETSVGSIDSA